MQEILGTPHGRANTWLWERPGEGVVAFSMLDPRYGALWYEVDAGATSSALESEIIGWGERRVQEAAQAAGHPITLRVSCRDDHQARIALLKGHGLVAQPVRTLHLERSLHEPIPEPQVPARYAIRHVMGEGEAEALTALHRAAFGTQNLSVEDRLSRWRRRRFSSRRNWLERRCALHPIIRPPRLRIGDTAGIAAPAFPFHASEEMWLKRGLEGLRRLGLEVRLAGNALLQRDHLAVCAQQRADDLNSLFSDPQVKAIICLAGGANANAVLPLLDWETIARHPKIVMGYSAITALLVGLYARTGLVTFHGPMVLDGFSEYPELLPYTRQHLDRVLFTEAPAGRQQPPDAWTTDYPREDAPRQMQPNPGWRWLRPGQAQGRLIGGNLAAMRSLCGTEYWPSFHDAILFIEEVRMSPTVLSAVDESLAHLAMLGALGEISGLVVGKVNDLGEHESELLDQLVMEHAAPYRFPVLARVDLGHTDPRLVLPIGIMASLDAGQDLFSLDEAAVV